MNVLAIPRNFATLSRPNGCLHRIEVSQVSRHLEARSLKQMGMPPVDSVGNTPSKRTGALLLGCGTAVASTRITPMDHAKRHQVLRYISNFCANGASLQKASPSFGLLRILYAFLKCTSNRTTAGRCIYDKLSSSVWYANCF